MASISWYILLLLLSGQFYTTSGTNGVHDNTDCCHWEGVGCDTATGHVTSLNLTRLGLYSHGIDQALFNLTSVQLLDLSMNDFGGSQLPAVGFVRLSSLTNLNPHNSQLLNLSSSGFSGQIPISIGKLTNLVSLDLSNQYVYDNNGISTNRLLLWEPSFKTLVRNFSKMRELYLNGVNISSSGKEWCTALGKYIPCIRVLSLENCGLYGSIHPSFSSLCSLEVINLRRNTISGAFPQYFADFLNLSVLMLLELDLNGQFPQKILELKHLTTLELSGNANLMVPVHSLPKGSSLETLALDGTNLSIAKPSSFGNLRFLHALHLDARIISKELSSSLSTLDSLEELLVLLNESFLSWIGNLKNLVLLTLEYGDFSRTSKSWIGKLANLEALVILNSIFSGWIPPEIGNFKNLRILSLHNCSLSGKIPAWIADLKHLSYVNLSTNNLSASPLCRGSTYTIIFSSGALKIAVLDLSENQLSGHIARSFWQLQTLNTLDLSSNNFSGLLELNTLLRLRKLSALSLSDNKLAFLDVEVNNTLLPVLSKLNQLYLSSCLFSLKHIQMLDLSSNQIQGTVPEWFWKTWSHSLTYMNLSHNNFSSLELSSHFLPNKQKIPVPGHPINRQLPDYSNNIFSSIPENFSYLTQTVYLSFARNKLSGQLPDTICKARMLEVLDLSYNNFSGQIPPCLIEDVHLGILNLRDNSFEGKLSFVIKDQCTLQTIDLNGNKIEGTMPELLSNCSELELSSLHVLVLRSNHWSHIFTSLQIIDLASNNLSGVLCPKWFDGLTVMMTKHDTDKVVRGEHLSRGSYQNIVLITYKGMYMAFEKICTTLTVIDFSDNCFRGRIPDTIGKLVSLHVLNLAHNGFDGKIPNQIGGMTDLESLDLSSNQHSGEIPQELTNLTFLGTLNLSSNQLVGRIPESHQFGTFQSTSFEGNEGLCGAPLPKQCKSSEAPSEPNESKPSKQIDFILYLFSGAGFGIGFAAAVLTKW
uniref:Disease resistance R13L4/SHOC-2-like LRR domain-containing protein n=1 Tax=Setaria italica TaxID=4555 RepID=K4A3A6_SETIT